MTKVLIRAICTMWRMAYAFSCIVQLLKESATKVQNISTSVQVWLFITNASSNVYCVSLRQGEAHSQDLGLFSSGEAKQGEESPNRSPWVWSSGKVNQSDDTSSR